MGASYRAACGMLRGLSILQRSQGGRTTSVTVLCFRLPAWPDISLMLLISFSHAYLLPYVFYHNPPFTKIDQTQHTLAPKNLFGFLLPCHSSPFHFWPKRQNGGRLSSSPSFLSLPLGLILLSVLYHISVSLSSPSAGIFTNKCLPALGSDLSQHICLLSLHLCTQ